MTLLGDMVMLGLTGVAMEIKVATFTDVTGIELFHCVTSLGSGDHPTLLE